MGSTTSPKVTTTEGDKKSWGAFPGLQHFKGKKVCQSFEMGTIKIDKQINYSYKPTQTKSQIG
jgi:hypothetical protein